MLRTYIPLRHKTWWDVDEAGYYFPLNPHLLYGPVSHVKESLYGSEPYQIMELCTTLHETHWRLTRPFSLAIDVLQRSLQRITFH